MAGYSTAQFLYISKSSFNWVAARKRDTENLTISCSGPSTVRFMYKFKSRIQVSLDQTHQAFSHQQARTYIGSSMTIGPPQYFMNITEMRTPINYKEEQYSQFFFGNGAIVLSYQLSSETKLYYHSQLREESMPYTVYEQYQLNCLILYSTPLCCAALELIALTWHFQFSCASTFLDPDTWNCPSVQAAHHPASHAWVRRLLYWVSDQLQKAIHLVLLALSVSLFSSSHLCARAKSVCIECFMNDISIRSVAKQSGVVRK